MAWGACAGEVVPQPVEDCASGEDQNCDGKAPACKGALLWAKRFGDAGDQIATGIATDAAGNVFVAGRFAGTVDFGGGPLTSAGGTDIFVVKLDASGSHLWSKRFGDGSDQGAHSLAIDGSGGVVLTGYVSGATDFGGGSLPGGGGKDVFVAKLDASGGHVWSRRFGDANDQEALSIAMDEMGDVLITGRFSGTMDLGGGLLTSAGGTDIFVAKLDAGGAHVWSKRVGDANDQGGRGIAVNSAGSTLITGYAIGSSDFGGGPLTSAGGDDAFVAQLDADGGQSWSANFGDASEQDGRSIAVAPADQVVVAGYFLGAMDFGDGPLTSAGLGDVFVAKLDANGGPLWSKRFGDASDQAGQSVAVDSSGGVLLTGYLAGAADFGGGPLASAGAADVFVAKLDASGAHVWSKRFGDTGSQFGTGVATDAGRNVLVTGYFASSVDFGAGPLTSAGGQDIFIAKFSP
jgi:hypothetical protein